ncbi:hypothetical protein L208DRAFT_417964 [Tricholoma matsutake]|nr:hypothetical protein L208DRAFT_417964 [Tricholoma matsutake 945]
MTSCHMGYSAQLRLKFLKVAQNGQLRCRKISEKIKIYLNIFHQNGCNSPTDQIMLHGLYFLGYPLFCGAEYPLIITDPWRCIKHHSPTY